MSRLLLSLCTAVLLLSCSAALLFPEMSPRRQEEPPLLLRPAIALTCSIVMFGIYTVNSVVSDPAWATLPRDLDAVELWTEAETIVKAAAAAGLRAEGYDILKDASQDLRTANGFRGALRLVMRLKPGGLLAMAPDCSSFGFGPSSLSGRKKGLFEGDTRQQFVRDGNLQANIAAFFLHLAVARGVEAFLENPSGSMMFSYLASTFALLCWLVKAFGDRCAYITSEQRATENYYKHYKFFATGDWISAAMRTCSCKIRHIPLMDEGPNGEKNGNAVHMKKSGLYPATLGTELVRAWMERKPPLIRTAVSPRAVATPQSAGLRKRPVPVFWESPWAEEAPSATEGSFESPWGVAVQPTERKVPKSARNVALSSFESPWA